MTEQDKQALIDLYKAVLILQKIVALLFFLVSFQFLLLWLRP